MENENKTTEEQPLSPFEKAEAILKSIEAANQKLETNLKRQEEIQAREMISGRSMAGKAEVKKEETAKEYAARVMSGKL